MRLTNRHRRKISDALIEYAFASHSTQIKSRKVNIFNLLVDRFLPVDFLEKTADLPDGWFSNISFISVVLPDGERHDFNVYDGDETPFRRVPQCFLENSYAHTFTGREGDSKLIQAVKDWSKSDEKCREMKIDMLNDLSSILASCGTLEQAYQALPESKDLIDKALANMNGFSGKSKAVVPVGHQVMQKLERIRDHIPVGELG